MSCPAERVTGYVDGVLDPPERAEIEAHLAACESCRQQADGERALRSRLLGLLHPALPAGLDDRVRERLDAPRVLRLRLRHVLLPLAAAAALAFVWMRGQVKVVAWEMVRDHLHCFGRKPLPAQVWSEDAETVTRWFEEQGTSMPVIPSATGEHALIGARYCRLFDFSRAAHVYYAKEGGKGVSLFVLARTLSLPEPAVLESRGQVIQVARLGDLTVGVVGSEKDDVDAFMKTFARTVASR
jgi:anti-sigma factor RsiW